MFGIEGNTGMLLLLLETLATFCNSEECKKWKRVQILNAALLSNGSVSDPESQSLYPPGTFWNENYNSSIVIYGCPCRLDRPCLRKCCQRDQAMDNDTLQCIQHDAPWPWFRPNVPINQAGEFRTMGENYFGLIFGNICLGFLAEPDFYPDDDKFFVNFTDGTLSLPQRKIIGLGPQNYCLDFFPKINAYLPYICIPGPSPDVCNHIRYIVYPLGMLISIFFLLASQSVYALLPSLRNLHGKCLMCHNASLLVAYVSLAIVQAFGSGLNEDACTAFGFVSYLSLLWSFFWLNIMCIDIFVAFSSIQSMKGDDQERDKKKFLLYVSYAWGMPLLIIAFTAVMELYPGVPEGYLKPKFKKTCWFESDVSRIAYFIAPVGIIVFSNTVLFLVTARNIFRLKKETEMLTMADNRRHEKEEDKSRFKLYIKLSIVMGVSWAMEIISWLVGGSKCIWLVTDQVNTLQGLFIFLIFVWNKKVRHQLMKRFRPESATERPLDVDEEGSSDVPSTSSNGVEVNDKIKKKYVIAPPIRTRAP